MESKRETIIFAALKLFGQKGFAKVTIKEIAAEAKVSQVTIYNNFNNKETLAEECTNVLFDKIESISEEILQEELPYPEKLNKVLKACNSEIAQSITHYFSSQSLEDPKLTAVLESAITKRKDAIYLKYLELGYSMGYINPAIAKESIIALMNTINYVRKMDFQDLDQDKLTEDLQQLFLYGIIGVKPDKERELDNDVLLTLLADQVRKRL
ncbi:TetR/AcrR family transcriptional regulator [Enterococcus sp. HY326]|uniref:TetR/AcrR family transcriptional regulator n=1 Tax=Enterococcus sp. HY326 TaxID=2971265 RepID=UPI00223FC868|nr:TetR/AcrR family transcriptional regulator [Enterococcus sp. HY326]